MSVAAKTIFLITGLMLGAGTLSAQIVGADGRPIFGKDEHPQAFREGLEKTRIDKEKKDHDEMIARGEEALKLTEQVERSYAQNGSLSHDDIATVGKVEKLVKRIRDELGGDNDEGDDSDETAELRIPTSTSEAVGSLKAKTDSLYDQLKQTTRFTISATAISTTSAVLRIVRFLKSRR